MVFSRILYLSFALHAPFFFFFFSLNIRLDIGIGLSSIMTDGRFFPETYGRETNGMAHKIA